MIVHYKYTGKHVLLDFQNFTTGDSFCWLTLLEQYQLYSLKMTL